MGVCNCIMCKIFNFIGITLLLCKFKFKQIHSKGLRVIFEFVGQTI